MSTFSASAGSATVTYSSSDTATYSVRYVDNTPEYERFHQQDDEMTTSWSESIRNTERLDHLIRAIYFSGPYERRREQVSEWLRTLTKSKNSAKCAAAWMSYLEGQFPEYFEKKKAELRVSELNLGVFGC